MIEPPMPPAADVIHVRHLGIGLSSYAATAAAATPDRSRRRRGPSRPRARRRRCNGAAASGRARRGRRRSVCHAIRRIGLFLVGASASARIRRPSASVLPISTVRPLRDGIEFERAEGVAGDGILHRRNEHAQPHFRPRSMIMWASASTVAAPPMSFFMISMPLSGLRSSPPVSKHTPLPTSVTLGSWICPSAVRSAAARDRPRGRRRGSAENSTAKDRRRRSNGISRRAVWPGRRRRFKVRRAHVVGRRVDEVARERHAFDDRLADRRRRCLPAARAAPPFAFRLAIAREAIGTERKANAARRASCGTLANR